MKASPHGIPTAGFRVDCDFEMSDDARSRVTAARLHLVLPASFPAERRQALLRVAEQCTVAQLDPQRAGGDHHHHRSRASGLRRKGAVVRRTVKDVMTRDVVVARDSWVIQERRAAPESFRGQRSPGS
ncbi:MAG: hypothetical protein WEB06_10995 [Actinomycetota bacterium]